jgi:cell division protein FtsL
VSTSTAPRTVPRTPRAPQTEPFRLRLAVRVQSVPRLPFVLLTGLVVMAGVLALAVLTATVNQQAFAVAKLDRANREASTRYSVLQAEVDTLKSPSRVSRVAHDRGLKPISRAHIVRWPSATGANGGTTSLTPGAATSPAAAGVPTTDPTRDPARAAGQVWTSDDPFPLKHYLAQP